jgi:hypothetical protein
VISAVFFAIDDPLLGLSWQHHEIVTRKGRHP